MEKSGGKIRPREIPGGEHESLQYGSGAHEFSASGDQNLSTAEEGSFQGRQHSSVRALDKAILVLEKISSIGKEIDLSSLSRDMKIPKSTLLRILGTLRGHNLIRQNEETRRFCLGVGLIALGRAAERHFSLIEQMRPFLLDLAEKTGETASLMVMEGDLSVYIDQVASRNLIRGHPRIGVSMDLHCSSGGKVLLSAMSDNRIEQLLSGKKLTSLTERTITDLESLKSEVGKIRELGYAVDDEEAEYGGRCVAVPVKDRAGNVIAAISIMGPTTRIRQKDFQKLAKTVQEEVLRASRSLGYVPNVSVKQET